MTGHCLVTRFYPSILNLATTTKWRGFWNRSTIKPVSGITFIITLKVKRLESHINKCFGSKNIKSAQQSIPSGCDIVLCQKNRPSDGNKSNLVCFMSFWNNQILYKQYLKSCRRLEKAMKLTSQQKQTRWKYDHKIYRLIGDYREHQQYFSNIVA